MKSLFVGVGLCMGLACLLAGCGEEQAAAGPKRDPRYVDPSQYYGSYTSTRIDKPDSEEVVTLTLNDGNSTFEMTHEGLRFGGNYAYLSGQMELYVYQVEGFNKSRLMNFTLADIDPNGRGPKNEQELQLYKDIMENIYWRFEVQPDGFKMVESERSPSMYEFKRVNAGGGGGAGAEGLDIDTAPIEPDWPSGAAAGG